MLGRKVVIALISAPKAARHHVERDDRGGALEGGKPVLAGFLEDVPSGARLK